MTDSVIPSDVSPADRPFSALARRVKMLRESLHLSQAEFAEKCEISLSFASLLERGIRSPSYETLVRVAKALEVPLAELFRESKEFEGDDPTHVRLLEFARRAKLSRFQIDRLIAVAFAMFGLEPDPRVKSHRRGKCSIEGCDKPLVARGMCASHYHRARRARV